MKNILKLSLVALFSLTLANGCIQETFPQTSYVTTTQAQVPGAIDRFVDAITATLCGFPDYGGGTDANDFGYPRFYIAWDSMGHLGILSKVEEAFDISFEPEEMMEMEDVKDIVEAVKGKLA